MLDWFKRTVAESTKPTPEAPTKVDRLADRLEAIAKAEHAAHPHRPEVRVERLAPVVAAKPVPAEPAASSSEAVMEAEIAAAFAAEVVSAPVEADEAGSDDVAEATAAPVVADPDLTTVMDEEEAAPVVIDAPKVSGLGSAANDTAGPLGDTRIIVVAGQKGGSGKTTLAAHLAIRAMAAGNGPVVLVDTDPQGSLTEWWRARNDDDLAMLMVRNSDLATDLAQLHHCNAALAVIDTPPALTGSIEQVIAIADLVVIPARPSPHDLRAIGATVELVRRAGKPFIFVVNGAAPRANITAEAVAALSEHGPVAPVILYQRTEYAASMIDGRTVLETATSGRSAQEVTDLWKYVYPRVTIRAAA